MDALATLGNWMAGIGLGSLFLYVLVLSTLLKCLRGASRWPAPPARAPRANAICRAMDPNRETECLDWLLIYSRRHLEHVLRVYIRHYNRQRPHRALLTSSTGAGRVREDAASR